MFQYDIVNNETKKHLTIYGPTLQDAFINSKLDPRDYVLVHITYID